MFGVCRGCAAVPRSTRNPSSALWRCSLCARNGKAFVNAVAVRWSDQKLYFRSGIQAQCFCPQAIAHYEQAADYYKGEESNRQVVFVRRVATGKGWRWGFVLDGPRACTPRLPASSEMSFGGTPKSYLDRFLFKVLILHTGFSGLGCLFRVQRKHGATERCLTPGLC